MEILLNANPNHEKPNCFPKTKSKPLSTNFPSPSGRSKDVFEKGDFINLITSDLIPSPQQPVFAHRIKRIDGQEFQFISDFDSTLHLLKHFLTRIHELQKNPNAKNFLNSHKTELDKLKTDFEKLLSNKN